MFNWKIAYAENYLCKDLKISDISDIKNAEFEIIEAEVPGNFELDLMHAGKLDDLFYSTNTLEAQKLENMHVWYFTEFENSDEKSYLHFEGIDTVSEIYVNGSLVKKTENMFIPYDIYDNIKKGKNELVVHILPVCIEARKYEITSFSAALRQNYAQVNMRKAAHMFGWDIMPRIVSAGIWKPVTLEKYKADRIKDMYFSTGRVDYENNSAEIFFSINIEAENDFIKDYSLRIKGKCGESEFVFSDIFWHTCIQGCFKIENVKLWWPRNYGDANLYDTEVELLFKGKKIDSKKLNIGVRIVELDMSDSKSNDEIGEFCFKVNGKRIFIMGTNWVPLDAFHSQDTERLDKALEMLEDIGCNAVRCWGGNVYESDEFFDFCDKHGIMVWQDFAMGCAVYPEDEGFIEKIKEEALYQIKRLRNHAALIVWAGDNECDTGGYIKANGLADPNTNIITRKVLKDLIRIYDYSRPYLPSSPYMSEMAYKTGYPLPEDHLWGPRDYFKGEYYKNAKSRFASETGYHGMTSPKSLEKFLKNPEIIFKENGEPTDEYLVHGATPELVTGTTYHYRIPLAYAQVVTLFGEAEKDFTDFVKQSQISQAEAKKYFIEKFRLKKWYCTGIIWWNLLDGWPQISDAVVDYYFCKKLAYSYIKRSQQPVCLMFDEPDKNNMITMYAVNECGYDRIIEYKITEIYSGEITANGKIKAKSDLSVPVINLSVEDDEQKFYLIEWTDGENTYKNHYCTNLINIDYKKYLSAAKKCGFDEFEGF